MFTQQCLYNNVFTVFPELYKRTRTERLGQGSFDSQKCHTRIEKLTEDGALIFFSVACEQMHRHSYLQSVLFICIL